MHVVISIDPKLILGAFTAFLSWTAIQRRRRC